MIKCSPLTRRIRSGHYTLSSQRHLFNPHATPTRKAQFRLFRDRVKFLIVSFTIVAFTKNPRRLDSLHIRDLGHSFPSEDSG